MTSPPNEVVFVSGSRGSGKSSWVKRFARSHPRVLIWDALGEYAVDHRFYSTDDLIDFLIRDESSPRFFNAAVDVDDMSAGDEFDWFCRAILGRGNLYVVIEELDMLATPYACPASFARLIKYGRHYDVQLVGVSRRPAEVSRLFTSQANRFINFGCREPSDLKYFRSIFGSETDRLTSLPQFHYLEADFSSGLPVYTIQPPIPFK